MTTFTYDLAGNLRIQQAPTGITTNTWDDENRRTLVALPSGLITTNSYNGDGLRYEKSDSTGYRRFVWDGDANLIEADASNVAQVECTQEPGGFGGLISQRRRISSVYIPRYHLFDGLGSTVRLTDAAAVVTDAYLYKAFGEPLSAAGSTTNSFRWLGQLGYYYDLNLLEYYLRARTYDPALARFLSQDPLGFEAGDFNLFRYVGNNPVNATDPSGLAWWNPFSWFCSPPPPPPPPPLPCNFSTRANCLSCCSTLGYTSAQAAICALLCNRMRNCRGFRSVARAACRGTPVARRRCLEVALTLCNNTCPYNDCLGIL